MGCCEFRYTRDCQLSLRERTTLSFALGECNHHMFAIDPCGQGILHFCQDVDPLLYIIPYQSVWAWN
jgi:hypothetical protein